MTLRIVILDIDTVTFYPIVAKLLASLDSNSTVIVAYGSTWIASNCFVQIIRTIIARYRTMNITNNSMAPSLRYSV